MKNIFLISDSHFGHAGILNFTRPDGSRVRPFTTLEEMHATMIEAWNSVVNFGDHVYHLGDFAIKQEWLQVARWLKGRKRLVRGNHDIFDTKKYIEAGFEEIYGVRVLHNLLLSHIPVHPQSLRHNWVNVHGHLHNNESDSPLTPWLGSRYFNVSTEVLHHTPIHIETILAKVNHA